MKLNLRPWTCVLCIAALTLVAGCGDDGGAGALVSLDAATDASAPASDAGTLDPLEVQTTKGRVRGKLSLGSRAFLGIPYATPPTGDKRWRAPQPAAAWTETLNAISYGPICLQNTPDNSAFDATSSEDCLTLNVWAPETPASEPLPVMVWLYGGAYLFGSGGPPYNGETLVREGKVVVVTLNYRMSELGFLAHPALSAEARAANQPTSNFGLLDQRLALQWVRDNIAAFGGDRENVTLFGESAGANSVCLHMVAQGSRGLFHKAIVESGLCMKPLTTQAEAEAQGLRYATQQGCTDPATVLSCLRERMPKALLTYRIGPASALPRGWLFYADLSSFFAMSPVIDGVDLVEQPEQAFAAGRIARVPVLHGINTSEGSLFHSGVLGDAPPVNAAEYQQLLHNRFGDKAAEVYAHQPDPTKLTDATTDALFVCPARRMATYLSSAGLPNFLYRFDLGVVSLFPALNGIAFHSAELPYVFGNDYLLGALPPANKPIASAMRGYWTQFAAHGDPNSSATVVPWPAFTSAAGGFLNLAATITPGSAWDPDCAAFWDGIPVVPL